MFDRNKNKKTDSQHAEPAATVPRARASASGGRKGPVAAVIGAKIQINGEITGDEDLVIQGHVEGTVNLGERELIIGESGRVFAELRSRMVRVDGEVTGNITGDDIVAITSRGNVKGNIVAPRVTLEDGAQFKGTIDMDPAAVASAPMADAPMASAPMESAPGGRNQQGPGAAIEGGKPRKLDIKKSGKA